MTGCFMLWISWKSDSCNEGMVVSNFPSMLKIDAEIPCSQICSIVGDRIAVCGGTRVIVMCFMSASMLNWYAWFLSAVFPAHVSAYVCVGDFATIFPTHLFVMSEKVPFLSVVHWSVGFSEVEQYNITSAFSTGVPSGSVTAPDT